MDQGTSAEFEGFRQPKIAPQCQAEQQAYNQANWLKPTKKLAGRTVK